MTTIKKCVYIDFQALLEVKYSDNVGQDKSFVIYLFIRSFFHHVAKQLQSNEHTQSLYTHQTHL